MTLVINQGISGDFVMVSSDTRQVLQKIGFNYDTGEMKSFDEDPVIVAAKYTKTHRLSEYVLIGGGGDSELSSHFIELLKKEVQASHDLLDCKEIFESILAREIKNKKSPYYLKYLFIKNSFGVVLNGFYRDGTTGHVWIESGKKPKISSIKTEIGFAHENIFSLIEVYESNSAPVYAPELYEPKTFEGLTAEASKRKTKEIILEKTIDLHTRLAYEYPIEISKEMEIHIISLEKNQLHHHYFELDLTKNLKHLYTLNGPAHLEVEKTTAKAYG